VTSNNTNPQRPRFPRMVAADTCIRSYARGRSSRVPNPRVQTLSVLIQQTKEPSSASPSFYISAYGDEHLYRPVHLDTLDDLLIVLGTVLPQFDASSFRRWIESGMPILFADLMELSDAQVSFLGFRDEEGFGSDCLKTGILSLENQSRCGTRAAKPLKG